MKKYFAYFILVYTFILNYNVNAQDLPPLFLSDNQDSLIDIISKSLKSNQNQQTGSTSTLVNFNIDNVTVTKCVYSDPGYFIFDISFAVVPINNQTIWNLSTLSTRSCFSVNSYTTPCFEYTNGNSSFNLTARIYKKKYTNPNDELNDGLRPAMVYVKGGGYSPNSGGLRNNDISNPTADDIFCKYLADMGFVVFNMDYRKGWDAQRFFPYKKIITSINTPLAPASCGCEVSNSCKSFTFLQTTYRTVQDIRACHRKILEIGSQLNIDRTKIYYTGGSTGAIAVMGAAFGSDDLPTLKEIPTLANSRTLANTCGAIDAIGVPLTSGYTMKVSGVFGFQAAMPYDINFIETSDNVDIVAVAQGTDDTPVNYCENTLLSGLFVARTGTPKDTLFNSHINLYGSGTIYNRIKSFGNKYGYFLELPGVEHELNLHGASGKRMKCYDSNPNSFPQTCNLLKTSFSLVEQRLAANMLNKTLLFPLISNSFQDFYVNGITTTKLVRITNALNCSICNYSIIPNPIICGVQNLSFGDIIKSNEKNISFNNVINLYPNPSKDLLTLEVPNDYEYGVANIFNANGQLIKTIELNKEPFITIDISFLQNGEYILYVLTDDKSSSLKFLKF